MTGRQLDDLVAIIGLASRFPGAHDTAGFWRNLTGGSDAVRFPAEEELLAAGVTPAALADPNYVRAVAETPGVDLFDAGFFGFTPRDATLLDPQIRMFLEVAHSALENGGYDPGRVDGRIGVYGAIGLNRYLDTYLAGNDPMAPTSTGDLALSTLTHPDYLATHLAYRLNLRGPAMTISTACSSSAVAVHVACQALKLGECDLAVVGGTETEMPAQHGYQWDAGGPMSPDGHCRPFDRLAGGTIFSTGVGAVVLKRLPDAVADGDHIWAVIRGTAVNNDGSGKTGFPAPSVTGQVAAVREAMALADVAPDDVSYIEAHATGTILGDPIEVAALMKAYGGHTGADPVPLSSVKGHVGHLGHASGIASLIKLALCLDRGHRAPVANFTEANPRLKLGDSPFTVADRLLAWPRVPGRPRIAAMNSLGIGGTNAHLIVEEPPERPVAPADGRPRVLVWSAQNRDAVDAFGDVLGTHLSETDADGFADLVRTLEAGRTPYPVRAAAVAADPADALGALAEGRTVTGTARDREVVFLFPGQAAQHARMGVGLYGVEPAFTDAMDRALELFAPFRPDLRDRWLHAGTDAVTDTAVAQPLLFCVEYALAEMWRSWGVTPDLVVGHSVGELVAATVAGVMEPADAVRLVAARADAMAAATEGGMLAVALSPDEVTARLVEGVTLAVVNESRQTVVAGARAVLDDFAAGLRADGVPCHPLATSHAFHSPAMEAAVAPFEAAFTGMALREPTVTMVSAATGEVATDVVRDPRFWARQLVEPVRFDRALDAVAQPDRVLLEVGPGHVLSGLAGRHPAVRANGSVVVATLPRAADVADDHRTAIGAAAALWAAGRPVDWSTVNGGGPVRRVPAPGYRYQRRRYWLTSPAAGPTETAEVPVSAEPAEGVSAPAGPVSSLHWVETTRPAGAPASGGPALVLLPSDPRAGLTAVLALQRAGLRPVIVRPGEGFERIGTEYRIRPDRAEDLDRVLGDMVDGGRAPAVLVHALALPAWAPVTSSTVDEQLVASFHSCSTMVQRGLRLNGAAPDVLVLTGRTVDVTGAEEIDAVKATLVGAVRTLAQEHRGSGVRLIDVAPSTTEADLADEIAGGAGVVVALRGTSRWEPVERPYDPPAASGPALRPRGVYVLTGGTGDLGLAVARTMAGTGLRPRLVLIGRRDVSEDHHVAGVVEELRVLGAEVRVERCDVADARSLRRVLDTTRARFGMVNGVVHLAGVAGDGILLRRTRSDAEAVLRPKLAGTLALTEAVADAAPLDFLMSFSSRASLGGLVGGGDYAAANAFLDAHARVLARTGVPAVSVNWPAWHELGMARTDQADRSGARVFRTVLSVDNCAFLDEHRIGSRPVLPGTAHLDLVVRAFRELVGPADTPVRLADVLFRQVLEASTPRRVTVVLRPDGPAWTFETASEPADRSGPRVVHATGSVAVLTIDRPEPAGALEELTERLVKPDLEAMSTSGPQLFSLGPHWDTCVRVMVDPDDENSRLAELALQEPFRAEVLDHPLYPTLLDSATGEARVASRDGFHLPFCYGSLELYRDLPARLFSHIRRRPAGAGIIMADVDLYDHGGALLARITGFAMRAVDGPAFLDDDGDEPTAGADAPADPVEGLSADEGGRIFLDLLGQRLPQVAVRPYRDGRPVSLPALGPAASAVSVVSAVPAVPAAAPLLPPTNGASAAAEPAPAAPTNGSTDSRPMVDRLAELWATTLGVDGIRPDSDFFDLGGTSLSAVELMSRIRSTLGVQMSMVAMFDHPTLAALATAVEAEGERRR